MCICYQTRLHTYSFARNPSLHWHVIRICFLETERKRWPGRYSLGLDWFGLFAARRWISLVNHDVSMMVIVVPLKCGLAWEVFHGLYLRCGVTQRWAHDSTPSRLRGEKLLAGHNLYGVTVINNRLLVPCSTWVQISKHWRLTDNSTSTQSLNKLRVYHLIW
jgi:hypothetical protein